MRSPLIVALMLTATVALAQLPIRKPPGTPPGLQRCCALKVYDANGKEVGEVLHYDERFPSVQLTAWVRYELNGGDSVAINVAPEAINSVVGPGGSSIVFTSSDCSGDAFVSQFSPPLTKRYAAVLVSGGTFPGPWAATNAWLYVTDPLPARVNAGATVFHSQWDFTNACTVYPAPGLTFSGGNQWGFKMHKVEDLYAKFKRPFWIP